MEGKQFKFKQPIKLAHKQFVRWQLWWIQLSFEWLIWWFVQQQPFRWLVQQSYRREFQLAHEQFGVRRFARRRVGQPFERSSQ